MTKERWTDTDGTALDYWLYTPENPAEDMPLIVYLHGGSGKGNDLKKILDEGSLPGYLWSEQLSKRNPEAKITELPGTDHFGVPEIYLDSETGLLDWLIAQKQR